MARDRRGLEEDGNVHSCEEDLHIASCELIVLGWARLGGYLGGHCAAYDFSFVPAKVLSENGHLSSFCLVLRCDCISFIDSPSAH